MCNVDLVFDLQENYVGQSNSNVSDLESSEIRRFELLRNELMELEKRVQRSAYQSENEVCLKHSTTYRLQFYIFILHTKLSNNKILHRYVCVFHFSS